MDRLHELNRPQQIINKMLEKDAFSNWLKLDVEDIKEGHCVCACTVRDEMLNGFGIAHGGITYSLGDTTLAFAANSYGKQSFSIETSISHLHKVNEGDRLIASAIEIHRGKKQAFIISIFITRIRSSLLFLKALYTSQKFLGKIIRA